jgi:hypothetical protein
LNLISTNGGNIKNQTGGIWNIQALEPFAQDPVETESPICKPPGTGVKITVSTDELDVIVGGTS